MAKLDPLATIGSLESATTAIEALNSNFSRITTAINKTLSRDGSTPNAVSAPLDMGSNRIINLAAPVDPNDAVRYSDLQTVTGALSPDMISQIQAVAPLAAQVELDAAAAAASALEAASYVGAATSAPKWTTARTLTLSGDLTGSVAFDGSTNISLSAQIASGSVGATELSSSAITDKLGYTPASWAGGVFIGDIQLNFSPVALSENSVGYRGVPRKLENDSRALVLADSAHMLFSNGTVDRTFTIPFNSTVAFPIGTVILVRVQNTGRTTIAVADPSIGLRLAGSEVSGSKRVNQWGLASLVKEDTNAWIISGTGIEVL